MRNISEIIFHCTATPYGMDVTANQIDSFHRSKGWNGIGYHFVIRLDGTIEVGRPISQIGAHCLGHNSVSIGIAYVGGLGPDGSPADTMTSAQYDSACSLIGSLFVDYPNATLHGHNEFANKACPCFDVSTKFPMF